VVLTSDDFVRARKAMTTSNRQFNRLDSILVESVCAVCRADRTSPGARHTHYGQQREGEVCG